MENRSPISQCSSTRFPLVYVVLLNYNGKRWLQPCIDALRSTDYENFKILFVDNNSSDQSVPFVRAHFPDLEVLVNERNLGFCEGNNVGTRQALGNGAEYIVLLNTDTKVTPRWLNEIVDVGEDNQNFGILGGIQLEYSTDGFNEWTLNRQKDYLAEISDLDTARKWIPTDWVHGSCLAVKKSVIENIGMLDPIYFMYCEETDFCRRAKAYGYEVVWVPRCRYHHYGGGSSTGSRRARLLVSWRLYRSVMIFHATDPTRSFGQNFLNYWKVVFATVVAAVKGLKFERIPLVACLQIEILRTSLKIARKWKADRSRILAGKG